MTSVAAKHAKGKKLKDVIFVTAGQAQADAKENGRENSRFFVCCRKRMFWKFPPRRSYS